MGVNPDTIPRYAEPTPDELNSVVAETCQDCDYYKEVHSKQESNGFVHCVCVCVFEVFQSDTFNELAMADLVEVEPTEEACSDFRG